jgi:tyrosyl-tRNA synthetase
VLLVLLRASIFGCQSIAIVGGATALVGDPSGRDNDRHEISTDIARNNVDAIQRQINDIYTNFQQNRSSSIPLIVINNNEWYSKMLMLDFLQISRSFRVGEMLRKRTMRTRPGISFTEFAYQILQSYDWLQLYRMHNCRMQIGGADQLGNFDAGYDLIKANCDDTHVFAVTLELMNDAIGHKMSKSSGNAIWLNAQRTSSYAFYQYFRQKSDAEIPLALRWFSLKSCDEIEMLIDKHERDPGRWLAQISLAEEMTELVHGCDGLESARRCARILFDASSDMNAFCDVQADEIESAIGIASTFYLSINEIRTMGQLADAVPPPNTSQRGSSLMKRGGLKINGQKLVDPDQQILLESICMPNSRLTIVCWGKRKYYLVKWID